MSKELMFLTAAVVIKNDDDWSCIESSNNDDWSCIERSSNNDDWSCIERM